MLKASAELYFEFQFVANIFLVYAGVTFNLILLLQGIKNGISLLPVVSSPSSG